MEYFLISCLPLLPLLGAFLLVRPGSLFSPLHLLFAVMFFGTVMKGTYLVLEFERGRLGFDTMQTILPGALALMLGNFAFVVGYLAAGRRVIRSVLPAPTVARNRPLLTLAYWGFVGLAFLLVFIYLQRIGALQELARGRLIGQKFFLTDDGIRASLGYLTIGAEFGMIIFTMSIAYGMSGRLERYFYWMVLGGTMLVFLISSQRLSIVYTIVLIFISMEPKVRTFSLFSRTGALIVSGFLLVGATVLRRLGQTGENLGFDTAFYLVFEHAFSRPYFITVEKTGLIVEQVTERSLYLFGESFVSLLFAPVPRELWVDKPPIRIGPYVSEVIYERGGSGIPPGLVGEFFMNFGWPGILIGMALLGLIARLVYNRFMMKRKTDADERVFYGIFAVSFMFVAMVADMNGGMLRFAKLLIAFLICRSFYLHRMNKSKAVAQIRTMAPI